MRVLARAIKEVGKGLLKFEFQHAAPIVAQAATPALPLPKPHA